MDWRQITKRAKEFKKGDLKKKSVFCHPLKQKQATFNPTAG